MIEPKYTRAAAYCVATTMLKSKTSQHYVGKKEFEETIELDKVVEAIWEIYGQGTGSVVYECEVDENTGDISVSVFEKNMVNPHDDDNCKYKRAAAYCVAIAMLESESSQYYIYKEIIEKAIGETVEDLDKVVDEIWRIYGDKIVLECEVDDDAVSVTIFDQNMVNSQYDEW